MNAKKIHEEAEKKTFVLVLESGDEVFSEITGFARENGVDAASLTAIGAISSATLGYFDIEKAYEKMPVGEQAEVISIIGDVAPTEDEPELCAHLVLGGRDGAAKGGHLLESPEHLKKTTDKTTGLALIFPET